MLVPSWKHTLQLLVALALASGAWAADRAQSGKPAVPAGHEIVNLPPFVVDETLPHRWRYARIPGVEVLSCCSDIVTQQLIEQNDRLYQLLEMFLPSKLQPHFDVPVTYVLYPEAGMPSLAKQLNNTLLGQISMAVGDIQFMPNIRCPGVDTLVLCFALKDYRMGSHQVQLTPGFLHYLLSARTPTLPQWYVEGMMELYRRATLSTDFSVGTGADFGNRPVFEIGANKDQNALKVASMVWLSLEETLKVMELSEKKTNGLQPYPDLQKYLEKTNQWVPLEVLLAPWRTQDPTALWLRRNQAALFIRWAFDPDGYALRQALWRFVDESCSQPPTEETFKSCFGMSYAAADQALRAYLPDAVRHSFSLPSPDFKTPPQADLKIASIAVRSRLKGRLERLEVAYVQKIFPDAVKAYRDQAFQTLHKSYDNGDRNPELLAELGLCHCDAGDDAKAEPFLAAAVKAKVVRPRVWLELARIRYADAKSAPNTKAAHGILGLLATAHRQAPPLPGVYELMVRVLLGAKMTPTPEQYAMLTDGVRLFPREVPMLYAIALLNASRGRVQEARALVAQALQVATDEQEVLRLQQLHAALVSNL